MEETYNLNVQIKILIKESEYLIEEDTISEEQFNKYKFRLHTILTELIQSDLKEDIKKNAYRALKPYQGKSKLDFFPFNWIYKVLLFKVAWNHNMPFLIGKRQSDIFKSQIPKIKMHLEAIDSKLSNTKI